VVQSHTFLYKIISTSCMGSEVFFLLYGEFFSAA
jgi:hypothetical protein